MTDLNAFHDLLTAFQTGKLTAPAFSKRYTKLWEKMTQEQDQAIKRQPAVSHILKELREMLENGEITSERYFQRAHEQYALLQDISIHPGSPAAVILDDLFVQVDAYREDEDEAVSPYINADELHKIVAEALQKLVK
jgi:hypothetical protein